ncbi:MAG: hypothetical protein R3344_03735 [Acidobacteriota bacterium]|nr:hypothetical protein [Acidobacteriota bacterium]
MTDPFPLRSAIEANEEAVGEVEEPAPRERLIGPREIHVYGGLVLLLAGLEALSFGLGLTATGAALFYIGVWRMR